MTCTPGQISLAQAQILLILWAVLPQLSAERNRDGIPPSQRKGILSCMTPGGTIWKLAEFELKKLPIRMAFCGVAHDHQVHRIALTVLHSLKTVSNIHLELIYQLKFRTNV